MLFFDNFTKKAEILFTACRCYSLPISFMSWVIPFTFALKKGADIYYGLLSLLGILILHMAANLFDDVIDYIREKSAIDKGLKDKFNFQEGKCKYIFNGDLTIKNAFILCLILFILAFIIGVFFIYKCGFELLWLIILTAVLCLLYPVLGSKGFGEVLIAIIFSPLLYLGVYFVMTGDVSVKLLILSISTGFLTVAILHNHMLLDYKFDETNRKITLCTISGNQFNAYILLFVFVIMAYVNLFVFFFMGKIGIVYLIPVLSLPLAVKLLKEMKNHINAADDKKSFLYKFMLAQTLHTVFTLLLCASIILDKM